MPARQTQALGVPGLGVEGDFADMNQRFSVLAGPGGLVSGLGGVYVGRAGWLYQSPGLDPDNAAQIVNNYGAGAPDGLIPRPAQLGLITTYLADASLLIQQGAPLWLMSSGGLIVKNIGSAYATVGMKAYASLTTGQFQFAAAGLTGSNAPGAANSTSTTVAAGTWSATGSITGNVMTVGTVTGTYGVAIGATVTGTNVATGTTVVAQLTGTNGGAGTYAVSVGEQTVAAGTSLSGTFGVLTVGATLTGSVLLGALVSGTGIPAGSIVTANAGLNTNFTGAGGTGIYATNLTGTGGSGTIYFTTAVETKWYCRSQGAQNELVKISDIVQ